MSATAVRTTTPNRTGLRLTRPKITGRAQTLDDARAGRGLVSRGSRDPEGTRGPVTQLQQQLKDLGYPIEVDGKFGPETQRLVRQFQQDRGIKVDGLVGPETMGQLDGGATKCKDGSHHHGHTHDTHDRSRTAGRYANPNAPTENQRRERPQGTVTAGALADGARARRTNQRPSAAGGVPVTRAPEGASQQERFNHYANIVRANGGQVNADGRPTVLGIRGMDRDGNVHDTVSANRIADRNKYKDTFVVLHPDGRVQEFTGATYPGQSRSSASPDVANRRGQAGRDGSGDVGMINAGNYRVVPNGRHAGGASFHVRTTGNSGRLPGVRDTDHNGIYSDRERSQSADRNDTLTAVLFHRGGSNVPRSIGCQTMAPGDYDRFASSVRGGFSYTLVDAFPRD